MNILLTSIGRRVKIVDYFIKAVADGGKIFTADAVRTAPGLYRGHKGFIVPGVKDPGYVDSLMDICISNDIKLVIPFIDPELWVLAKARERFARCGIYILLSSCSVVGIAADKLKTAEFFTGSGIPAPLTIPGEAVGKGITGNVDYPVVVKPRYGSSGLGVHICQDQCELSFFLQKVKEPIIQGFVPGAEITIDILCDLNGKCLSLVPRKRIKVRGGEVERAVTVGDADLIDWGLKAAEALKPKGPINVQCIKSDKGVFFIEINPRFGGGYPLSYEAGARFPDMIVKMMAGQDLRPTIGLFQVGLVMMRYDEAVYRGEENLIGH